MAKVYTKQNFATNPQADLDSMVAMDNAIDALDTKLSGEYIVEQGGNHIKYEKGRMGLEWEVTVQPNSDGKATITFPLPFANTTNLFIFTQPRFTNSPNVSATIGAINASNFDIYFYSGNAPFTQAQIVHVLAKGNWK